jgi:hypothetical protein
LLRGRRRGRDSSPADKEVRRINVELDRVKTGRAIDPVSQDRVSEETIRNLGKLCADHHFDLL